MSLDIEKTWLTVKQCAAYLGLTERAIYCLVGRGLLPTHRLGRRLYFLKTEIDSRITYQN